MKSRKLLVGLVLTGVGLAIAVEKTLRNEECKEVLKEKTTKVKESIKDLVKTFVSAVNDKNEPIDVTEELIKEFLERERESFVNHDKHDEKEDKSDSKSDEEEKDNYTEETEEIKDKTVNITKDTFEDEVYSN